MGRTRRVIIAASLTGVALLASAGAAAADTAVERGGDHGGDRGGSHKRTNVFDESANTDPDECRNGCSDDPRGTRSDCEDNTHAEEGLDSIPGVGALPGLISAPPDAECEF